MKLKLIAMFLVIGCHDASQHEPDAAVSPVDTAVPMDAPPVSPALTCQPASAPSDQLCGCLANIVCDQIYFCLTPAQLANKPAEWSPKSACVDAVLEDCTDDMASDPVDYFPADFRRCIADLGSQMCSAFGSFSSITNDFPASCDNLRSVETALGIQP
jgi:hypothetical protein